jgi:hypothetical protein
LADPKSRWQQFEELGEEEVRRRLGSHVYKEETQRLANQWLLYRASSDSAELRRLTLDSAMEANDLARKANELASEANSIARSSAAEARTSNTIAKLALAAATIAIVISIISLATGH